MPLHAHESGDKGADKHVLRIAVRDGFTRDLAAMLLADLSHVVDRLADRGSPARDQVRAGFHH
ncbi:MAG: hypothetical protein ACR2LJ_03645 [Acidimicrobiales bacterium]